MKAFCLYAILWLALTWISAAHAASVLNRGLGFEPASLDPHKYNTRYEAAIILDLFKGLTVFERDGTPRPGVALGWSLSGDGRTWTFTLRPGMRWSDGKPITAADVVLSFHRLMDPATAASYAPLLYIVENGRTVNTGAKPVEALGIHALSDWVAVLRLNHPAPYLPELLANAFLAIVPRHIVTAHGDTWIKPENVVSNDAFVLVDRTPQGPIVLASNRHFREKIKVRLGGVTYYPSADLNAAVTRFRAGELGIQSGFSGNRVASLRAQFPNAVRIAPALETFYLALNTTIPALADRRVRRALSLAIDRDLLAEKSCAMAPGRPIASYRPRWRVMCPRRWLLQRST